LNPDSTSEVLSALRDAQKRLTDIARPFKDAERLLKELSDPRTRRNLKKIGVSLSRLRALPPVQTELTAELGPLIEALEAFVQEQERSRPLYFGRSLREAAEAQQIAFSVLTSEPPEYRLAPFSVGADFRKGRAELRYARLALCEVDLDPESLLKARLKMLEALDTKDFCPERFFDRLLEAYRRVLEGRAMGERVNLVDLLPELAFLGQSERFRKDPIRDHYQPYGRVRLAWDLARLRRSGSLSRKGLRLGLGTATMSTTRKKEGVLFLEDETGRGQYYLSLCFAPDPTPQGA
jgi:hypothetical protein